MFTIPNHEPFMTTIGKLNFFRWALESNILEYMEAHEEEIRSGYNSYLKETIQIQKRNKTLSSTASSTSSTVSTDSMTDTSFAAPVKSVGARTTRRRTKQSPSSLNKLQVYTTPIELDFS
jgi:hypothetical protein